MARLLLILFVLVPAVPLRAQDPKAAPATSPQEKPPDKPPVEPFLGLPLEARGEVPKEPSDLDRIDPLVERVQAGIAKIKKDIENASEADRPRMERVLDLLKKQVVDLESLRTVLKEDKVLDEYRKPLEEQLAKSEAERQRLEGTREERLTSALADLPLGAGEPRQSIPPAQIAEFEGRLAEAATRLEQADLERLRKDIPPKLQRALAELAPAEKRATAAAEWVRTLSRGQTSRPRQIEDEESTLARKREELEAALAAIVSAAGPGASVLDQWQIREQGFQLKLEAAWRALMVAYLRRHADEWLPTESQKAQEDRSIANMVLEPIRERAERLRVLDAVLAKEELRRLGAAKATAPAWELPLIALRSREKEVDQATRVDLDTIHYWNRRTGAGGDLWLLRTEVEELRDMIGAPDQAEDEGDLPESTSELQRLVQQAQGRLALVGKAIADLEALRTSARDALYDFRREKEALDADLAAARAESERRAAEAGVGLDDSYDHFWTVIGEQLKAALTAREDSLKHLQDLVSAQRKELRPFEMQIRSNLRALQSRLVWTREESAISWESVERAAQDVQQLPNTALQIVKAYAAEWWGRLTKPENRAQVVVLGGILAILIGCFVLIHRRLPATFTWLESYGGNRSRLFRVLAILIRRTEIVFMVAMAFLAICAVSRISPRETGAIAVLFLAPAIYRFVKVLNDLLFAPRSPSDRLVPVGDAMAGSFHAVARWLLNISVVFVPLGLILEWEGYSGPGGNPGFLQLWWLVYQLLFSLVFLIGVFRPAAMRSLIRGEGRIAASVKALIVIAYPIVAGAIIFLFMLKSLRYEVAATFFRGVLLESLLIIVLAYVFYRYALQRLLGDRDYRRKVSPEDFDTPQQYLAAGRQLASDLLGRLGVRLLIFGPALFLLWGRWREVEDTALSEKWAQTPFGEALGILTLGAITVLVTVVVVRHFRRTMRYGVLPSTSMDQGVAYAVLTLSTYVLVGIGLVIALKTLRVRGDQIAWIVSALAVGIGFGLQDIVKGFVAGLILLVERPVKVGDQVHIANQTGVVDRINMRSTTLLTFDNTGVIIPNQDMISNTLINRSSGTAYIRTALPITVDYSADTKMAMKVMMDAMLEHGRVRKKPAPEVYFTGFGDSALEFEMRFWSLVNENRLRIASDLRSMVFAQFKKLGLEIPYAQRDLHVRSVPPELVQLVKQAVTPRTDGANGANGDEPPAPRPQGALADERAPEDRR